jgi:hypothetical protein
MTPSIHRAALSENTHLRGLVHLARSRGPRERCWHIWIGPAGLHLFWPDAQLAARLVPSLSEALE